MQVYCINMVEDRERRENILSECSKHGLTPEFIVAVDGGKINEAELETLVFDPGCNPLTRGEIGCALSHLKTYEKFLADGHERALILEDDIRISDDLKPYFETIEQWPIGQPDIFLITDYKQFRASKGRTRGEITFYPIVRAHSAHAYVITRKAAENLLAGLRPIRIEADYWKHFVMCGLVNVWVCREIPIRQNRKKFHSHLEHGRKQSFLTKERKQHIKRVRSLEPLPNKVKHFLWKVFARPFEKISVVNETE